MCKNHGGACSSSEDIRRERWLSVVKQCISFLMISPLSQVKPHKYVKECEAAKSIVVEALRLLCDLDWDDHRTTDPSNRMSRPRVPHELLFVFGGWSGGTPTNLMEVYDTKADSWVVSKHHDVGKTWFFFFFFFSKTVKCSRTGPQHLAA